MLDNVYNKLFKTKNNVVRINIQNILEYLDYDNTDNLTYEDKTTNIINAFIQTNERILTCYESYIYKISAKNLNLFCLKHILSFKKLVNVLINRFPIKTVDKIIIKDVSEYVIIIYNTVKIYLDPLIQEKVQFEKM